MDKHVSAADANREFSRLLQQVKKGESFVVTSHGKPVAKITPFDHDTRVSQSAWKLLLARFAATPARDVGRLTRDELYDE
ncbi:Prevent-host-death protein [Candidatus Koribacter versatilis Ellin345]|uniref:Antitoxin n=1 Tax=Koribacter versatilis (strain Ellin345) TaxID=204669 RepID=Q1II66_KORVE|nr:type II toxin-antitoxin system prevent-host-death family antitoxin [Candidatus Koribacter versatilis]ABF43434.1 Prevent-host-death protein [Candidatus Koribacter versatilis Ellin345]